MKTVLNHTGKAQSIPGGMLISAFVSLITTMMLSAVIAYYLSTQMITWEQAGYWIMGMLFIAAFLGGKIAYKVIKRQRVIVSFMAGILYWTMLLCISVVFFGGRVGAVWETAGIIAAGSGISALIFLPNMNKRGSIRHHGIVKLNKK